MTLTSVGRYGDAEASDARSYGLTKRSRDASDDGRTGTKGATSASSVILTLELEPSCPL